MYILKVLLLNYYLRKKKKNPIIIIFNTITFIVGSFCRKFYRRFLFEKLKVLSEYHLVDT